ncbi:MAG: hypothetical protein H6672_12080 [Anaerolineaceae bacterium]|nr:hypothetical protein [Anaerolineaceae bacterium]
MSDHDYTLEPGEELTYCTVHPTRETGLRCNKCGRYMCAECAVLTPVGYRCRECVRQHEDKFYTSSQLDYVIVAAVCGVLSGIAGYIISSIGLFLILMIFIGLPVGGMIGEVALRAIQRRRGRQSGNIGAVAAVIGGFLGGFIQNYSLYSGYINQGGPGNQSVPLDFVFNVTIQDLSLLVFVGVVAFAVYGRFKMRI